MALRRAPSLAHLVALTDDVGIVQHALFDVPNRSTGYCTDDVSRALMVAISASAHERTRDVATDLARTYMAFMVDAQMPDGRFHNFMSYARDWLDDVGTEDSNGRAVWSLGYVMRFAPLDGWRQIARGQIDRAIPHLEDFEHPRSRAYAAIGVSHAFESLGRMHDGYARALRSAADMLAARHARNAAPDWDWYDLEMTYDNARLPEAMLRIGAALEDPAIVALGLRTLDFYASVVMEDGVFVPVGNAGWAKHDGHRARFGQQPLEAASLVDAALCAAVIDGSARYRTLAGGFAQRGA